MNPKTESQNSTEVSEDVEMDNTLSIDEFIKELEAKEKDLHISSEMVIEVEESDIDDQDIPDFLKLDVSVAPNKVDPFAAVYDESSLQNLDVSKLQSEISTLQNQLAKMESHRVELFESSRRRQVDFENYKSRTERERGETFRNQLINLATQMLPVVDNLNRALDLTENIVEEKPQDFQQFFEGIVLVSQQLNEILAEMGVQPITSIGEVFDPHLHEAVATDMDNESPHNTVTEELLRGYRIGEKIIRPSMVKVSTSA